MSTNQIYVESTYTDYRNNEFRREFVSDNDLMNMSPSVFKTFDNVMNVVWTTIGSYQVQNAMSTILQNSCVENPLLVLRNPRGVFDVSKTGVVIDGNNNPVTDVEAPVSLVTFEGKGVMIFGFKDGSLQLFIGFIRLVGDIETYQVTQKILVSEQIDNQKISVAVGLDHRILILYLDGNSMLKGIISSDYGLTFSNVSIVDFLLPEISTSTLITAASQQLSCITNDGGLAQNNVFSCNSADSYNFFTTISIINTDNVIDSYPGVFFDMNFFNSTYISFLQNKNTSPNNSNIIVMKSDDGSLSFFTLRQ